jgi:hypothetical protein
MAFRRWDVLLKVGQGQWASAAVRIASLARPYCPFDGAKQAAVHSSVFPSDDHV